MFCFLFYTGRNGSIFRADYGWKYTKELDKMFWMLIEADKNEIKNKTQKLKNY